MTHLPGDLGSLIRPHRIRISGVGFLPARAVGADLELSRECPLGDLPPIMERLLIAT